MSKTKYKVGDKVRIAKRLPGNKTGAMDYNKPNGDVGKIGIIERVSDKIIGKFEVYSDDDNRYLGYFDEIELTPAKKTLRDMKAGDYIVDHEDEAKVLAVLAEVFLLSSFNSIDGVGGWYTFKEAEKQGFKLKGIAQETITINNKTYRKEDVIARLVGLEEVQQ